ncbi:MAG TPA: N-acetylmuramoyl-L-alanine amidase [Longimicrobium sp.]|nr:N-acetylmuramoyl-L-alanine amidase [Longimicrobium sp.]
MRLLLALLLVFLPSLTAFLPAQPPPGAWQLVLGQETSTVLEVADRGYPAVPVSALLSLGARLSYGGGEVTAAFGAREVRFRVDSREVVADGRPLAMANPVYSADGVVFVPAEFLAALLHQALQGVVTVDASARVVRADPAALAAAAPAPAPPPPPVAQPQPAPATQVRRLVVIDAGHGGRDPGAIGPMGTREKDITLQMARRVYEILRTDPTLDVRLTRNRDTLIALRDRARFANSWRAEGQPALFMSIHCNAHASRAEVGFETFFLSEARTADARRVQQMEDAAEQYEEPGTARTPLDFIMSDLRQNQYLRESSEWAQLIQDRLRQVHPGPDRGVKQAGFAVLVGAFMPAVLVEIGFISNRTEEQMLLDPERQQVIARQLATSVHDFFRATERRTARAGN